MPTLALAVAAQTNGAQTSRSPTAGYVVFALAAVVVGLVVLFLIRANARRSKP